MEIKGKSVCVIGAGKSGIGSARLLLKVGASVILYDANTKLTEKGILGELPENSKAEVALGEFPENLYEKTDLAVISPGVPTDLPFVNKIREKGIPLWGELELAYHYDRGEVMAITGTNGKTTTTSLLGHIMKMWKNKVFVVGNIGEPYTESTLKTKDDSVTVVEVSSFQLETIRTFHPVVTAILNITPDHMNRHYTMENYIRIKENITKNQNEFDTCVLNYEDKELRKFGKELLEKDQAPEVLFFSSKRALEHGIYLDGDKIVYDDGLSLAEICDVHELKLIGIHNYENVMAACGMALRMDVPPEILKEALKTFHAVPHRMEFAGEKNGVIYYNDSKGTNPDAAIRAIKAMNCPTYLIGGGYDKNADYNEWIRSFDGKVKKLVLIGATREKIRDAALACGFEAADILLFDTFEEAFAYCAENAKEGEGVLLSPACASWGMFDNYEQRGDRFKELTAAL